jgi:hypothetical protein
MLLQRPTHTATAFSSYTATHHRRTHHLQELEGGLKVELQGTQKALAAREAELRVAAAAAQQLPGVKSEAQRLQAEVPQFILLSRHCSLVDAPDTTRLAVLHVYCPRRAMLMPRRWRTCGSS